MTTRRTNRLRQFRKVALQLRNLFLKFFKDARDLRPIESNRRRLAAKLGGFKKRRHGSENAVQHGLLRPLRSSSLFQFSCLLSFFERLPIAHYLACGVRFGVGEYMRMTIDQFVRQAIEYVIDRKVSGF